MYQWCILNPGTDWGVPIALKQVASVVLQASTSVATELCGTSNGHWLALCQTANSDSMNESNNDRRMNILLKILKMFRSHDECRFGLVKKYIISICILMFHEQRKKTLFACLLEKLQRYKEKCLGDSDGDHYNYETGNIHSLLHFFCSITWFNNFKQMQASLCQVCMYCLWLYLVSGFQACYPFAQLIFFSWWFSTLPWHGSEERDGSFFLAWEDS